jgi:hypothetical protein
MKSHPYLLVITAAALCCNRATYAQQSPQFECGFVYEKMEGGKSGAATCSYTGENVFAVAKEHAPTNEHCRTAPNSRYEDLVNFRIDLTTRKVAWDRQSGLSSFALPQMIEYYMRKENLTKEAATAKVAKLKDVSLHYDFDIIHTDKIADRTNVDELTQSPLKDPIYTPAYLITFRDAHSNYSIYISEKNSNAVLSEYVSDLDTTWVNLRFGKCRKVRAAP